MSNNQKTNATSVQVFKHEKFGEIRTLEMDGEPMFVAADVARALGYKEPHKAIATHCKSGEGMKHTIAYVPHPNGVGGTSLNVINEGNMYRLIMRSDLPSAIDFQDWVCGEVLPAIRKTGSYSTPQASAKLTVSGADNNLYLISIFKAFREFLGEEFKGYCFTQLRFIEKWEAANKLFPEDRKKLKNAVIKT